MIKYVAAMFCVLCSIFYAWDNIYVQNVRDLKETDPNMGQQISMRDNENGYVSGSSSIPQVEDSMNEVLDEDFKRVEFDDMKEHKILPSEKQKKVNDVPFKKPVGKITNKAITYGDGSSKLNHYAPVPHGGFQLNGVDVYNGRLVAPISGTYITYSNVQLYEPCLIDGTPNIEDSSSPIKHAIYKYSVKDKRNVEVAVSVQPHKKAERMAFENVYSSYISTVLDLHAGDELYVQVSNISMLKDEEENFFGLRLFR